MAALPKSTPADAERPGHHATVPYRTLIKQGIRISVARAGLTGFNDFLFSIKLHMHLYSFALKS
jgi:hypothetical protein